MRPVTTFLLGVFCTIYTTLSSEAQEATPCGHAAFAAVVGETGGTLTSLNEQNRRSFMEKLQALKAQEAWDDANYAVKAKTYVQDEKIAAFDASGKALLEKVKALGGGDSLTEEQRCVMLEQLKGLLAEVVTNTREKWSYMFDKLNGALKPAVAAPAEGAAAGDAPISANAAH
jgi:hypothetical protein